MSERLQKLLAQAGYGSRRQIEDLIRQGLISVNGKIAKLGDRANSDDQVRLKGQRLKVSKRIQSTPRVLLYNKPSGEVSTRSDEKNRRTVFDRLPKLHQGRWIQIGRLDINTDGLLLFTTDGMLAHHLMHPSQQIPRTYAVRVLGEVSTEALKNLRQGVKLEDGMARFESLKHQGGEGANQWYHVNLHEGRNREVRRLWESQGVQVARLIRIAFGDISLPRYLSRGQSVELKEKQVQALYTSVKLKYPETEKSTKTSSKNPWKPKKRPSRFYKK